METPIGADIEQKTRAAVPRGSDGLALKEGRKRIEEMSEELFGAFTLPDGCIDLTAMRKAVKAGFAAAEKIPVEELGVTLDCADAEEFFAGL